jgi:DNA repair exonuclease SbcCD ATPase subunit
MKRVGMILLIVCLVVSISAIIKQRTHLNDYALEMERKRNDVGNLSEKILELESELKFHTNQLEMIKSLEGSIEDHKRDKKKLEEDKTLLNNAIEDLKSSIAYSNNRLVFFGDKFRVQRELLIKQADMLLGHSDDYYMFYGLDANKNQIKKHYFFEIPENMTVEEQLSYVASNLSVYSFSGYPIDILRIERIDGRQIAFIDLKDPKDHDGAWLDHYLTGLENVQMTALTLIETFLQKETPIEWIDGIHFSFEGAVEWETDYAPYRRICNATYFRDGTSVYDD